MGLFGTKEENVLFLIQFIYEDASETNSKMAAHAICLGQWEFTQPRGTLILALLNVPIVYNYVEK